MNTTQSKTRVPAKASTLQMMVRFAALLLAALLAPSASAQFIYVANTAENTVSKIDISTDTEVARYMTWFDTTTWGPAPSRIVKDAAKNVYVLDRFLTPPHLPVLLKIAPLGGAVGTTSNGPGLSAVVATTDNGTIPTKIDPGDTKDARILWGKEIGTPASGGNANDEGATGRALCIDRSGFVWVGMHETQQYYKVDPATGNPVGSVVSTGSVHKPYGCQVDTQGRLWSVDGSYTLAEIDTVAHTLTKVYDHSFPKYYGRNYSVSLLNACGSEPTKVYLSDWTEPPAATPGQPTPTPAKTYIVFDPQTSSFSNPPITGSPPVPHFTSLAVAVDLNGNSVSGEYRTGRVIKVSPAGNLIWETTANTLPVGNTVSTTDLHGIIIDDNNDVWAVDKTGNQVVKYRSLDGRRMAKVAVGSMPYTYGNPPAPSCPCAKIREQKITCDKQKDGTATYSWSFTFTNNSPFSMPVKGIEISSSQVTSLTPTQVTFPNPGLPPNGQGTVSGTFEVKNPLPGSLICLDIRLQFGDDVEWCCPTEQVCFVLPECPTCAKLEGQFKCKQGQHVLNLSVTNVGPTAAAGAQIFSNTPGVTVSPSTTTLAFPQNTAVIVPSLTVTGATPGQVINLSVMLHGPIDPKTGVNSWCCTATVRITYPVTYCWWLPNGDIFDDINANGVRDSGEGGLAEWTVTLTDAKGKAHTTKSDASGKYQFEEIEPGKSRLSVQPPQGWRATAPKGGAYSLTVEAPPKGPLDFGFVKTR